MADSKFFDKKLQDLAQDAQLAVEPKKKKLDKEKLNKWLVSN